MIVVDRKPIPIYEVECHECHSKIQYRSAEVGFCGITCPVCGVFVQANTICPVRMEEGTEEDMGNEWMKQTVSGLCGIKYYKCPKCGAEDQIQAPYCRMCGKRLKECSISDKRGEENE